MRKKIFGALFFVFLLTAAFQFFSVPTFVDTVYADEYDDNEDFDDNADNDGITNFYYSLEKNLPIIIMLICFVYGVFSVAVPEKMWYLRFGWRYNNVESSDAALIVMRIGGVVAILIGTVILGFFFC